MNKFNIGDIVIIPKTYIFDLGENRKKGIVEEVYWDEWNEIYKYKIRINASKMSNYKDNFFIEWFMEEELTK